MRWTYYSIFRAGHKTLNLKSILEFNRCQSGAILPVAALMLSSILVLGGLGLDYGNAVNVRSKLQNATDSAVSAASTSALETDAELNDIVVNFINTNAANHFSSPVTNDISIQSDTVSVTSSTVVETMFSKLIGFNQFKVSVTSTAKRQTFGSEVVIAGDGTGSMGGGNSRADAKAATADILGELDCLSTEDEDFNAMLSQLSKGRNIGGSDQIACLKLLAHRMNMAGVGKGISPPAYGAMRRRMKVFRKLQMR